MKILFIDKFNYFLNKWLCYMVSCRFDQIKQILCALVRTDI